LESQGQNPAIEEAQSMRSRFSLLLLFSIFTSSAFAIERWIMISGTVGEFHTDARVFNPSFDKDIQIAATFVPTDGSGNLAGNFTVPKRQMRVFDDVTSQLFSTTKLGGILFTSADEFEVTSRIYAQKPNGTLGQFGPGVPLSFAKAKGALLQLSSGQRTSGSFRTNIGAVNPSASTVTVTWKLYAKDNSVVSTREMPLNPMSVLGPTNVTTLFTNITAGADLGDAWVSYSTSGDTPILVYASVVDNSTTDQTFVPAVDDKGIPPTTPPPPISLSFDVELENFSISFSPAPNNIKQGDTVTLRIKNEGLHGFQLNGPNGATLVSAPSIADGGTVMRTFTAGQKGTYGYFCTNTSCDLVGGGHNFMAGTFTVGEESDGPGRDY
jgi:plastocyanin